MAKKTNKTKNDKVITISDSQQLAVTNRDHKNVDIKSMIRVIRGQQVMLDSDLAMLYGVETRALNQAVKRNIGRFPDDFMFQLTKSELGLLKSQIVTSKTMERRGGTQKPPYAFTRNGIGMLSSVLRSETAVGVNILIMRAFTAIPQIVNQNVQMVQRIFNIEQHQMETDEKIEMILDKIEEIAPSSCQSRFSRRVAYGMHGHIFLGASLKDVGTSLCAVKKM